MKPNTTEIPLQWNAISAAAHLDLYLLLDCSTFAATIRNDAGLVVHVGGGHFDLTLTPDRRQNMMPLKMDRPILACVLYSSTWRLPNMAIMAWGEKQPHRRSILNTTVFGDFGQDGELHCVTAVNQCRIFAHTHHSDSCQSKQCDASLILYADVAQGMGPLSHTVLERKLRSAVESGTPRS